MTVEKETTLFNEVIDLIDHNDLEKLKLLLNSSFPQDISDVIEKLDNDLKYVCFKLLNEEQASNVLSELDTTTQMFLLKSLGIEYFAKVITLMNDDDAADFIVKLAEKDKQQFIKILPDPVQQAHIKELIHYHEESAGGIMSTDFLKLRSDMTVSNAFNYVREQASEYKGQIYYLYIVDTEDKLVGIITLRNLISSPPNDILANHMNTEVISCNIADDQEKVAKTISKYDLIALPIIDDNNVLKGIVTIDDVVDILDTETTEDIYQGSGISDVFPSDELIHGRVTYAVRARLPWLLLTLCGQTIAAVIISSFDKTISALPMAVSFMPLLSGLSGNVGGQTATIIVRGLVTGDIEIKSALKHIFHEVRIGFLLGLICATITGFVAWYQHGIKLLGLVVAFALTCSMTIGVLLGTIFPILLQYFKKDPATACSPMITTMLDMVTFALYLTIISKMIGHLR